MRIALFSLTLFVGGGGIQAPPREVIEPAAVAAPPAALPRVDERPPLSHSPSPAPVGPGGSFRAAPPGVAARPHPPPRGGPRPRGGARDPAGGRGGHARDPECPHHPQSHHPKGHKGAHRDYRGPARRDGER